MRVINHRDEDTEDIILKVIDLYEQSPLEHKVNLTKLLKNIFSANSGFVILNDDMTKFFLAVDVYAMIREDRRECIKLLYPDDFKKEKIVNEMTYLYQNIVGNCWTSFFCLTNEEVCFDNPFVDELLACCLNYNFIFITPHMEKVLDYTAINKSRDYDYQDEHCYYNQIKHFETEQIIYYQICRFPELIKCFDDDRFETIPMILPKSFKFKNSTGRSITLKGFKEQEGNPYFIQAFGGEIEAVLYEKVTFQEFYHLEHCLNVFSVCESMKIYDGMQCLIFYSQIENKPFYFPELYGNGIKNRLISDIYSCIPVRYENYDRLFQQVKIQKNNFLVNNIITGLIFQENFEYGNSNANDRKFKDRIRRIDLETVNVVLTEEMHYNYYEVSSIEPIDNHPIFPVRVMISADLETHSAVLFLICFGGVDYPSKYLDMISRNEIIISLEDSDVSLLDNAGRESYISMVEVNGEKHPVCNLYEYLEAKYGISKRGVPKNFIQSPFLGTKEFPLEGKAKSVSANKEYAASILYSESLFEEEEELGKIVDDDMYGLFKKPYGDAVYDYSKVYISKTALLQCGETFRDYTIERIDFAVVALYYLELISFEEAAIQIASYSISQFMKFYNVEGNAWESHKKSHKKQKFSSKEVLSILDSIDEEYAKTVDFWDVQMNYTSSKKCLDLIRNRFEINKSLDRLNRNKKQVFGIYNSRKAKIANISGYIIMILGFSLTAIKVTETLYNSIIRERIPESLLSVADSIYPVLVMLVVFFACFFIRPLFQLIKSKLYRKKKVKK